MRDLESMLITVFILPSRPGGLASHMCTLSPRRFGWLGIGLVVGRGRKKVGDLPLTWSQWSDCGFVSVPKKAGFLADFETADRVHYKDNEQCSTDIRRWGGYDHLDVKSLPARWSQAMAKAWLGHLIGLLFLFQYTRIVQRVQPSLGQTESLYMQD